MLEPELEEIARADRLPPGLEAEIVRLHDAAMGIDALGARFRLPYATITAIVARQRPRHAAAANAAAAARAHEGL